MKKIVQYLIFVLSIALLLTACSKVTPVPTSYKWTYYATKDGLIDNNVNDLAMDAQGNIWVATEFGVSMFDGVS